MLCSPGKINFMIKMQDIKNNEFTRDIISLLEPMGEIESQAIDNIIIGLYKSGTLFGLIIELNLFLRTNVNNQILNVFQESMFFQRQEYSKVNKQLFITDKDKDNILQAATMAYWLARGKLKT